jgi:hypothetical protein
MIRCPACRSLVPVVLLWAEGDLCPRCFRKLDFEPVPVHGSPTAAEPPPLVGGTNGIIGAAPDEA